MSVDAGQILLALRDHAGHGGVGYHGAMLLTPSHAFAVVGLVAGLVRGDDDAHITAASALGIDLDGEEQ